MRAMDHWGLPKSDVQEVSTCKVGYWIHIIMKCRAIKNLMVIASEK